MIARENWEKARRMGGLARSGPQYQAEKGKNQEPEHFSKRNVGISKGERGFGKKQTLIPRGNYT